MKDENDAAHAQARQLLYLLSIAGCLQGVSPEARGRLERKLVSFLRRLRAEAKREAADRERHRLWERLVCDSTTWRN